MERKTYMEKLRSAERYVVAFVRWGLLAALTGLVGGGVGTLFHKAVEYATAVRIAHSWILYLLPVGGLVIVGLYHLFKTPENFGTNQILDAIRSEKKVPLALPRLFSSAPLSPICAAALPGAKALLCSWAAPLVHRSAGCSVWMKRTSISSSCAV